MDPLVPSEITGQDGKSIHVIIILHIFARTKKGFDDDENENNALP